MWRERKKTKKKQVKHSALKNNVSIDHRKSGQSRMCMNRRVFWWNYVTLFYSKPLLKISSNSWLLNTESPNNKKEYRVPKE